jgi:hypothetical protein
MKSLVQVCFQKFAKMLLCKKCLVIDHHLFNFLPARFTIQGADLLVPVVGGGRGEEPLQQG